MQTRLLQQIIIISIAIAMSLSGTLAYADSGKLIPAMKSGFYYQMGGGNDMPLPAFYDTSYLPLDAGGDVGLEFDCGVFNPIASIRNSLNEIKSSSLNVERQVLSDATAAVTEFPLYELSRSDPNLYNLITNAMAGAREDIAISTKSCETMQSEIAAGENPYAHWGQLSLGNRWQEAIGSAELSGKGDINKARFNVSQDAGKSGVPWVNTALLSSSQGISTDYAGGINQPPVRVIHDAAMAGYHVIASDGQTRRTRWFEGTSSELSRVFPTDRAAANWIIQVAGDETITTYNGGKKSSQPGVGLYADIQYQTQQLLPKLQTLVTGDNSSSELKKELQTISPDGLALSPQVINAIKKQPSTVIRSIIINKLAQNIAAMDVINKARLAMRILQSGSRIPVIYANKVAQQTIQRAIVQLQQDIQNILMFVKARQTLMSNMLATVMQAGQAQTTKSTVIGVPTPNAPMIEDGAIAASSSHAS